jgi:hypothetical protein
MRIRSLAYCLVFTLLIGGCAIHPEPKDVTGLPTFEIVQQIRCETRQAIIDLAFKWLDSKADSDEDVKKRLVEFATTRPVSELSPTLFKGQVRELLSIFLNTGVAYNYNLDMTENNNADGELDFLSTLSKGTFGLGLKAGVDRSRQNTRTFTVTDTFGALVHRPPQCEDHIVGPNYVYPISGQIGVERLIQAFVYLSLFGNLASQGDPNKPAALPNGPPTLVDALLFTTTISGSVTPQVNFAPIGRTLSVSHAQLDLAASRIDKHQVVIGLALDVRQQQLLGAERATLEGPRITAQAPFYGGLLTASGNRAERIAANAVNQYLTQKLFSPTINITP